jgi:quinol monooxygenase YgiN
VEHSDNSTITPRAIGPLTRRSAIGVFAAVMAMANVSSLIPAQSQSQQTKDTGIMSQSTMHQDNVNDIVRGGGLLVVAQWEAKEGQADAVAAILRRFLPQAQADPGAKLFLIGRGKDNPAQFLFYELFVDEAALAAHQESAYFKSLIAGQALPLLSKRERAQYALL